MHVRPRITLAACAAALLLTGAAPAPDDVACGDVLTTSVTLTADLVCENGRGLRIAAPLTLDLGGHALVLPDDGGMPRGYAVTIDQVQGLVTVRNGSIRGWRYSTLRLSMHWDPVRDRTTFEDLEVSGSARGIVPSVSTVVARRVTFRDNEQAIECDSWCSLDLDHVVATGNRVAVRASYADLTVRDSTFRDNQLAIFAHGTLNVERSTFYDNYSALSTGGGGEATVRGNVFRRNDEGVYLESTPGGRPRRVVDNLFAQNCRGIVVASRTVADVSRNVLLDHGTTAIVTRHAADVAGNVIKGQGGDESCRRWTR